MILDKPFKTFLEQVEILDARMKTDEDTIYYLMRNNYYSIVNFYKDPFLINKGEVKVLEQIIKYPEQEYLRYISVN